MTRRRWRSMQAQMTRLVLALAGVLILVVVGTAPAAKDTLVIEIGRAHV